MSVHMESVNVSGAIEARFGWNAFPRQRSGGLVSGLFNSNTAVDCDARAVFCKEDGTPISQKLEDCCLFYGNMNMFNGAAIHQGDNRVGGSGDDEIIRLDLHQIPKNINQIILSIDLFKQKKRVSNGAIQEAFMRITDNNSGIELMKVDISYLSSSDKVVVTGKLLRNNDCWEILTECTPYKVENERDFLKLLALS